MCTWKNGWFITISHGASIHKIPSYPIAVPTAPCQVFSCHHTSWSVHSSVPFELLEIPSTKNHTATPVGNEVYVFGAVVIYGLDAPKGRCLVVERMFSFWKKYEIACLLEHVLVIRSWFYRSNVDLILRKSLSLCTQGSGVCGFPHHISAGVRPSPNTWTFWHRNTLLVFGCWKYTFWFPDVPQKIGQNANVRLQNWCTEVVMMDRRTTTSCTFLTSTPWNGDNPKHLASAKIW